MSQELECTECGDSFTSSEELCNECLEKHGEYPDQDTSLKWTRATPTEVGWYWIRRRYSVRRERVVDVQKVTYDMLGPGSWGDTEFAGPMMPPEWAGPIREPEEG